MYSYLAFRHVMLLPTLLLLCDGTCLNKYISSTKFHTNAATNATGIGEKVVLICNRGWLGTGFAYCTNRGWNYNITCRVVCPELPQNVCFVRADGSDHKVLNAAIGSSMPTRCCTGNPNRTISRKTCLENGTWFGAKLPCEAEDRSSHTNSQKKIKTKMEYGLTTGAIVGIVFGLVAMIMTIALLKWFCIFKDKNAVFA